MDTHQQSEETKKHVTPYRAPGLFSYSLARIAAFFVARVFFRRKFIRNEIRGVKGAYLVIGNHEASLDFVNLIGATRRRMTFVISNSFFNSLPVHGVLKGMNVIPKQQFQTELSDLRKMKAVVQNGHPLALYPAGMMTENGLSTPIPEGTYSFLRWLGVDVYMAKTVGTYFAMPKWTKGFRSGKTYMDIYKLFGKEELKTLSDEEIRRRTDEALLFDAYREQEKNPVAYRNGNVVAGLENVLYTCPSCNREFSIHTEHNDTLTCACCGYSERSDEFGFLHLNGEVGEEIRYVSDWSSYTFDRLKEKIDDAYSMTLKVKVQTIDYKKHHFRDAGAGTVALENGKLSFVATVDGEKVTTEQSAMSFPILPFSPGKYFELQDGKTVYRCLPEDGRIVMKFINSVRVLHERALASREVRNAQV